jgi:hypothetical protein
MAESDGLSLDIVGPNLPGFGSSAASSVTEGDMGDEAVYGEAGSGRS